MEGTIRIFLCVHLSLPYNAANLVIDDVTVTTKIHGCQLYTTMNSPIEIFTNFGTVVQSISSVSVTCYGTFSFKLRSGTKCSISQLTCLPQSKTLEYERGQKG